MYCRIFDFDGTLTTDDTLLEFIKFSKGWLKMLSGFLLYSPLLILMKLHLYPNYKAKQKIFAYFFAGMSKSDFDSRCSRFAMAKQNLLRPEGVKTMHEAVSAGEKVMVVSASIDNWVRPFFVHRGLEQVEVLGTEIEAVDGKLTGRFLTNNCYGPEKVARIKKMLTEPRTHYYIRAYGDSRGDKEMLDYADERYFKPFRR